MAKKAKILLVVSGLFTFALGLSNVFVNILLWKKTNDFILIAGYNLMHYVFAPFAFIIAGWLAKRRNGIWPLRIGVALFVVFFSLILLLKNSVVAFIYPLGILFGTAVGFYWLSFHVLSFDFTSTNNRDTFNGFNGFIAGISNAAAPFTAALIIQRSKIGYSIVFGISLALFAVLVLITLFLRCESYGKKLDLKRALSRGSCEWSKVGFAIAAWGMRDAVIIFLITVLIFKTAGSEMAVGKLTLYAYLISSAAFITEQKIIKPGRRRIGVYMGAVMMFAAVWGLATKVSMASLFTYVILDAVFMPFFIVPLMSESFNIINRSHDECLRVEYVINKEIMLNTGRIISTLILLGLLIYIRNERALNYFLLFIGGAQLISLHFIRKLKIWNSW